MVMSYIIYELLSLDLATFNAYELVILPVDHALVWHLYYDTFYC